MFSVMSHESILLTDLISDCSGFQLRSWFAVRGRQSHPSPRRSRPSCDGVAAVAASEEKVARYIFQVGNWQLHRYRLYNWKSRVSGEMKAIEKPISVVKADGIRATKIGCRPRWIQCYYCKNVIWPSARFSQSFYCARSFFSESMVRWTWSFIQCIGETVLLHLTQRRDF